MTSGATIPHPRTGKPMAQIKRWQVMDIDNPPQKCGVYAIKSGSKWMYIGRSICVGTRINARCHPVQIMREIKSLGLSYWWHPVERSILARTELFLIRKHSPEWNGGTHFEPSHYPPYPSCMAKVPLTQEEQKRIREAFCAVASTFFNSAQEFVA